MRVSVVAFAVLAAVTVSTSRCHAGSTDLPGSDAGAQSPGLATDLPGSDLSALQPSLTRPSSLDSVQRDAMESGALVKVLKDPSLLAAAPGTPARAALSGTQPSPTYGAGTWGASSPGTAAAGSSAGLAASETAGAGSSAAATSGCPAGLCASTTGAPSALISSSQENPAQDGTSTSAGLLSSRPQRANPVGAPSPRLNPTAAGLPQEGGLFTAAVTAQDPVVGGTPGAGPSAGAGSDVPGAQSGPALTGSLMALAAAGRARRPESSHRFAPTTLAWLGLAAAPFAALLFRRRLV